MRKINHDGENYFTTSSNSLILDLKPLAYSPKQFSIVSGISIPSLARDRENGCMGGIPFRECGGRILYPHSSFEAWLSQDLKRGERTNHTNNQIKRPAGRPKGTTKSALSKRNKNIGLESSL